MCACVCLDENDVREKTKRARAHTHILINDLLHNNNEKVVRRENLNANDCCILYIFFTSPHRLLLLLHSSFVCAKFHCCASKSFVIIVSIFFAVVVELSILHKHTHILCPPCQSLLGIRFAYMFSVELFVVFSLIFSLISSVIIWNFSSLFPRNFAVELNFEEGKHTYQCLSDTFNMVNCLRCLCCGHWKGKVWQSGNESFRLTLADVRGGHD